MVARVGELTAELTCRCGRCRIILGDPTMRYRIHCLCYDCRQRPLIAGKKRPEFPLPDVFVNDERGADVVYFANALLLDDSSRLLLVFGKLRTASETSTAWATCCDTPMCSSHPFYAGNGILVSAAVCQVSTAFPVEPQFYDFVSDFPAEKVAALPPLPLPPVVNESAEEMEEDSMRAFLAAVQAPIPPHCRAAPYTTFEELCARKPIHVDDVCYDESRCRDGRRIE